MDDNQPNHLYGKISEFCEAYSVLFQSHVYEQRFQFLSVLKSYRLKLKSFPYVS